MLEWVPKQVEQCGLNNIVPKKDGAEKESAKRDPIQRLFVGLPLFLPCLLGPPPIFLSSIGLSPSRCPRNVFPLT